VRRLGLWPVTYGSRMSRAMTSASTTGRPCSDASSFDTVDLPEAIPPVRPTTGGSGDRREGRPATRRTTEVNQRHLRLGATAGTFQPSASLILTEHERQRLGTLQRGRAAGRRGGRPTARAVPPSPAAPAPVAGGSRAVGRGRRRRRHDRADVLSCRRPPRNCVRRGRRGEPQPPLRGRLTPESASKGLGRGPCLC
jgi:hypothetical protein